MCVLCYGVQGLGGVLAARAHRWCRRRKDGGAGEGRGHVVRSSAVPTRDRDEDDGVVFGSDDFGSTRVAPILLSQTPSRPSPLGAVRAAGPPSGGGG